MKAFTWTTNDSDLQSREAPVFDLKDQRKKVKVACLSHCQLEHRLYSTLPSHLPRVLVESVSSSACSC